MKITYLHPQGHLLVGYIPDFLPSEKAPAKDQFNRYYSHGGGWRPMTGWEHLGDGRIKYPGDPVLSPVAEIQRPAANETVYVYQYAWVMILASDGTFEIARMD